MIRLGRRPSWIACFQPTLVVLAHTVGHFSPPPVTLTAVAATFLLAVVVPTRRPV